MCLAPNDKDARLKMNECEKLIRKIEFLKAIEQSDPPSAAEGLDLDSMGVLELAPFFPLRKRKRRDPILKDSKLVERLVVENDYDGVRLEKEMTQEFIDDMIERFKNGKKIHKKYAFQIILKAKEIFYDEPTMPEVTIPDGNKMTICGDTHGTLALQHHIESR